MLRSAATPSQEKFPPHAKQKTDQRPPTQVAPLTLRRCFRLQHPRKQHKPSLV